MNDIRGFTYQTLIDITANIESQEMKRAKHVNAGFSEHPRAATTDDVECFFSLVRRHLGGTFTLKEFSQAFPWIVRYILSLLFKYFCGWQLTIICVGFVDNYQWHQPRSCTFNHLRNYVLFLVASYLLSCFNLIHIFINWHSY